MTKANLIVTHTAPHQADEVAAIVALRIINPGVKIVRTRDSYVMHNLAQTENAFLLDIGGDYDPDRRMFDHHQHAGAGYRYPTTKEWPYATAGLIWKHYGAQVVRTLHPDLSDMDCIEVAEYIDVYLIRYLDAIDCGVRVKSGGPSLSAVIASFNPAWFEKDEVDSFPLILDLAQVVLTNFIRRYAGKILARDRVRKSNFALDGKVLVLDQCLPWSEVVAEEMPNVLLVAYPVPTSQPGLPQWQIKTAVNSNNTPRMYLPQTWGGYEGPSLASITGIEDVVFCHRSRHLAGTTSKESALELAKVAIEAHLIDAFEQNLVAA